MQHKPVKFYDKSYVARAPSANAVSPDEKSKTSVENLGQHVCVSLKHASFQCVAPGWFGSSESLRSEGNDLVKPGNGGPLYAACRG
jgi:hypothetical protein